MKKLLIIIAAASIFAACNNTVKQPLSTQVNTDSIRKAVLDSIKLDSFQRAENLKKEKAEANQAALANKSSSAKSSTSVKGYSESHTYAEPQNSSQQSTKKGWSSAAKGATIGGAAGAVTGILVDKKDGRGALIGGAVGAGTGYVIGRANDRKTGRVQPKD